MTQAPIKSVLGAAGFGAIATMAVLVLSNPSGHGSAVVVESKPTVAYGVTQTQSTAPSDVEIPAATPPVKAQPAPTAEPG